MSTLNVASINGGPIGGMRNALINGNPFTNQRGYVSGTATSGANQYTLDRWRVASAGQSITWTDSQNARTVTAPAGGVEQVIEGLNLIGGSYVLSWVGTATATVAGAAVANGATVTLAGGVDTTVRFSNGTFALAQLEPGTRATPFERRPTGTELALCQRYFQYFGAGTSGQEETATLASIGGPFLVAMRAAPSVTLIGSTYATRLPGTDRTYTSVTINSSVSTNQAAWILLNTPAGGNVAGRFIQNRDAGSNFQMSAEL